MGVVGAIERHSGADAPRVPDGVRIYAIGDVHGRLDLFERLIAAIRDDAHGRGPAHIRIVLLGDLIDRGPDSAALVDRCRALAARSDRFVVLKGNHEAMMVHAVRGNFAAFALWMRNGGLAALRSWGVADAMLGDELSPGMLAAARAAVPEATVAWLDALPLTLAVGDYLFVHAGIRPGVALASQSAEDLLWIRSEFLDHPDAHGHIVVHGHSIDDTGAVVRANRIGIDTGAYRTGVLTALCLERDARWMLATSGAEAEPAPPRALEQNVAEILRIPPAPAPAPRRRHAKAIGAGTIAATVAAAAFAWFVVAPPAPRPIATAAADHRVPRPALPIGGEAAAGAPAERRGDRMATAADRPAPQLAPIARLSTPPRLARRPSATRGTPATARVPSSNYPSATPAIVAPRPAPPSPRAPDLAASADVRIAAAPEAAFAMPGRADAEPPAPDAPTREAATPKQRLSKTLESIDAIRLLRRQ